MSLLAARIITLVLMGLGTFIFGILPIPLSQRMKSCICDKNSECKCAARRGKQVISFLLYFGGGVLLALCLLDLIPETREKLNGCHGGSKELQNVILDEEKDEMTTVIPQEDTSGHEEFPLPEFLICCGFFFVYFLEESLRTILGRFSKKDDDNNRSAGALIMSIEEDDDWRGVFTADAPSYGSIAKRSECAQKSGKRHFSMAGLLVVVVLSSHSLFEGFAMGLQDTETATWTLFFAIAVHKFILAFVLGLEEMVTRGRKALVYVYMVVFSVMCPAGATIATVNVTNLNGSCGSLVGTLSAVATGTLLYVTFLEILQRSNSKELCGLLQMLATFVGFGVMAVLQYALGVAE